MRTKAVILRLIYFTSVFALAAPLYAQKELPPPRNFSRDKAGSDAGPVYERVIVRKFDVRSNPNVRVDGSFGPVTVAGATANTVEVTVKIRVEESSREDAKRRAEQVDVQISGTKDDVQVRTGFPHGEDNKYTNVSISLLVPKQTTLSVHNKFGSIDIRSVTGDVSADCEFGALNVMNGKNLNAHNSFGDITLSNVAGACKVDGKNGKIRAFTVGSGRFTNRFGSIDIDQAAGAIDVQSKMGSVVVKRVHNAVIKNEYGAVLVVPSASFSGTVKARTSYGSISSDFPLKVEKSMFREEATGKIGGGGGELILTNAFGEIKLRKN